MTIFKKKILMTIVFAQLISCEIAIAANNAGSGEDPSIDISADDAGSEESTSIVARPHYSNLNSKYINNDLSIHKEIIYTDLLEALKVYFAYKLFSSLNLYAVPISHY